MYRTQQRKAQKNEHKQYPVEPNGIELILGGIFSSLALFSPRKGLNLYESPVKYLSVSAGVLLGYYAILTFADIYCFKVSDRVRRQTKTMGGRLRDQGETAMAAIVVALLAVTPAILTLEAKVGAWQRALLSVDPKSLPEKWAAGFFWSTMVTSWAFAYFMPMDWDRPWQKWPIPIVGGAFLGYLIGLFVVGIRCFVLPLARADFIETEESKLEMTRVPLNSKAAACCETKKEK
ncbi:GPI biosynthesis protein family Pig-F-domain-containing protein [Kickxella alabastrina]|uniref:GPI biosynthesis protein family Pig-F-domain-containing protein n=1 Tax=Kickxella alabastrina TaxID=61397 RepID=UPI00221EB366|nr:GPI biosynthesis protein family Pig-F-domain-containing protein [Kickxella alabastrina]KAI7832041.1 GPI biosynthesis protein family Pig-F-domain-containing protein [Kickxella alabastrina]